MTEPKSDVTESRGRRLLRRVWAGYRNIFSLLTGVIPLIAAIVVLSALVVLPLWYLATYHRAVYTVLLGAIALGGTGYLLLRRIRRGAGRRGGVRKATVVLATVASALLTVRLLLLGSLVLGIPLLLVTLLLTGVAGAPKKRV